MTWGPETEKGRTLEEKLVKPKNGGLTNNGIPCYFSWFLIKLYTMGDVSGNIETKPVEISTLTISAPF